MARYCQLRDMAGYDQISRYIDKSRNREIYKQINREVDKWINLKTGCQASLNIPRNINTLWYKNRRLEASKTMPRGSQNG